PPRPRAALRFPTALGLVGDDLSAFLSAARPEVAGDVVVGPAATAAAPWSPPDDLVGRDRELRILADLVSGDRHRLVTVTGRAGVGKSRIVAELAASLAPRTDVTVRMLDLSAVYEPELVGELIAAALGCGPSRLAPRERIAAHLGDERVLLVLDRFEQLVAAAPELVDLLRRCPDLRLVVTSQRRLQVRGERVVALEPLTPEAAAELFALRAAAVSPGFTVDDVTAPAVAAICGRVEHLPLAIELAAARIRLLHPVELADRLDDQLRMIAGGARDLPARHRSLRTAIESSLEVVAPRTRDLFRRLGAFTGGARLGDIEAVAVVLDADRDWLLAALTELVDINLVRVHAENTASRYTLPESMAALAGEQLRAAVDGHRVARAVAAHFLARVRAAHDGSGPAMDDRDAANIRAGVGWASTHEPTLVGRETAAALARFYETTGRLVEGQQILRRLAVQGLAPAWVHAGRLAVMRGDLEAATELGTQGLACAAATDHVVQVFGLNLLAQVAVERGDPATARTHLRAALVQARRAKDMAMLGRVLNNLASVSIEQGQPRPAERLMLAALAAKRRSGAGPIEVGRTLFNLSDIALELGKNETAVKRGGEAVPLLKAGGFLRLAALAESTIAIALLRHHGPAHAMAAAQRALQLLGGDGDDRRTEAVVQLRCSVIEHAAGNTGAALRLLHEAARNATGHTTRDRDELADALQTHALYLARRVPATAATMLGLGDRIRRRPIPAPIQPIRHQASTAAQQSLGKKQFDEHLRAGAALDQDVLLLLLDQLTNHI
ncbi:AAA family ATPase, partial [Actinoplanes sp. NPDC051633]|uniref:ATP-binding protein n=1 Tax=Actinoplanes sp. NPDC051633 TaxID=3155670 RepID=UPI00341572DB